MHFLKSHPAFLPNLIIFGEKTLENIAIHPDSKVVVLLLQQKQIEHHSYLHVLWLQEIGIQNSSMGLNGQIQVTQQDSGQVKQRKPHWCMWTEHCFYNHQTRWKIFSKQQTKQDRKIRCIINEFWRAPHEGATHLCTHDILKIMYFFLQVKGILSFTTKKVTLHFRFLYILSECLQNISLTHKIGHIFIHTHRIICSRSKTLKTK